MYKDMFILEKKHKECYKKVYLNKNECYILLNL